MSNFKKACITLAAGQGKRMGNPETPKVLATLHSKPLLTYVFDVLLQLDFDLNVTITGFKKEIVDKFVQDFDLPNNHIVHQLEQLGTGHAVNQAREHFKNEDFDVLILCGDVPLLQKHTILELFKAHYKNDCDLSVLSAMTEAPQGYGRIIRDDNGMFLAIKEEKDANIAQRAIKEVNSGIYIVKSKMLFEALSIVGNSNAQGEYYLTDVVGILANQNKIVEAFTLVSFEELQGINTQEDLERAGKYLTMIGK